MIKRFCSICIVLWVALMAAFAQGRTKVQLILPVESLKAGETFLAGVELSPPLGWHIYWRYAGTIGIPTTLKWTLPPGVTAGEAQWPLPEKGIDNGYVTYFYPRPTILLVPIQISTAASAGPVKLQLDLAWLECNASTCVPGSTTASASFQIGAARKESASAKQIEQAMLTIPPRATNFFANASLGAPAGEDERELTIRWKTAGRPALSDFFPYAMTNYAVDGASDKIVVNAGDVQLATKLKQKTTSDWPKSMMGLIVEKQEGQPESSAYEVVVPIEGGPITTGSSRSLPVILLFAFLGGMILNIMPCVLPVIALKILGFVRESGEAPARLRWLGLAYTAGVLASLAALAGVVIAVRGAGHAASWGMQLQNPQMLVLLTTLIVLIALNLFGVFEVTLSGNAMGGASKLASREGIGGAFFNGILATVLATPCTAPFLGAAIGFAFVQPPPIILLVFVTVGLGLACPYMVLCLQPKWLGFLPKPGVWMQHFKIAMGFPMLATGVWLFTLAASRYGAGAAFWFGLFLVLLALTGWIWGEFVQRGRSKKGLAMAVALICLGAAYFGILEKELSWRHPLRADADAIAWSPWSPEAVQKARDEGKPVLVDFTADWCLTCQVNKRLSIEVPSVRAKLKELGVVALVEDSFEKNKTVVDELARHGRSGVPLVLVYPKDKSLPPIAMPDGYFSSGILLKALEEAAK